MTREELITQLLLWTNYSEEYLLTLSTKEIEKIHRDKVEIHG
jgi:hypothetical protein